MKDLLDYIIKTVLAIMLVLVFFTLSNKILNNSKSSDLKYLKAIQLLLLTKQLLSDQLQQNKLKITELLKKNKQLSYKLLNIKVYSDTLSSLLIVSFIDNFIQSVTFKVVR